MAAVKGMGTTLSMGGFAVADVTSIAAVSLSGDVADVTTLASTSGYEEALSTVLRTGEFVFSLVWDPDSATHGDGLVGAIRHYREQTLRTMVVTFANTNASTWTITGYITGISITAEQADALRADVTVKTTGAGAFLN